VKILLQLRAAKNTIMFMLLFFGYLDKYSSYLYSSMTSYKKPYYTMNIVVAKGHSASRSAAQTRCCENVRCTAAV